jgi:cell division GTPase FtsZ
MQEIVKQFQSLHGVESQKDELQVLLISGTGKEENICFEKEDLKKVLTDAQQLELIRDERTHESDPLKVSVKNIIKVMGETENISAILIKFSINPELPAMQLMQAMTLWEEKVQKGTVVIFATDTKSELPMEYVKTRVLVIKKEMN